MPNGSRNPQRVATILLGLTLLAVSRDVAGGAGPKLSTRIRERMQAYVDRREISGAVALVGRAEGVISLEAIGWRDVENDLPMRADTLFRIASMTKPVTAIGVMMLVDEGKLSVEDPVEKHLSEFRDQKMVESRPGEAAVLTRPPRPITIRDLLTHTSGMPAARPAGSEEGRPVTLAEAVREFARRPLDFAPGTRWAYCNPGIDTLGRIVEVVSGERFDAFLKRRLFEPLGMTDTTFNPTPDQWKRVAVVYNRKGGELRPAPLSRSAPPPGPRLPSPSAGLFSTAPDLARLYRMMLNRGVVDGRRYLSAASVREMTRVQTGELPAGFSEGMGFGLGWSVVRRPAGVTAMLTPGAYGHGGGLGTQCWIDPEKGLFTVLLTQRPDLNPRDEATLRSELPRIAFGDEAR